MLKTTPCVIWELIVYVVRIHPRRRGKWFHNINSTYLSLTGKRCGQWPHLQPARTHAFSLPEHTRAHSWSPFGKSPSPPPPHSSQHRGAAVTHTGTRTIPPTMSHHQNLFFLEGPASSFKTTTTPASPRRHNTPQLLLSQLETVLQQHLSLGYYL